MKLGIIGDGMFGSFLKELLEPIFEITDNAPSIILAVPISAYNELGQKFKNKHLINVCSVQKPSTDILLKYSEDVTGLHPLFGRRTPNNYRNSILSYSCTRDNDTWQSTSIELEFLELFSKVSGIITVDNDFKKFTPETHDILMAKTHAAALRGANQLKVYTDAAKNIRDELLPHSFRLMKEFVKTLDDMPKGTLESIMANPYI